MTTLNNWLTENEFILDADDTRYVANVKELDGIPAEAEEEDWSLFIGDGFVVENTIQGTRVVDTEYTVQSWPTHVEVKESDDGISAELLHEEVANAIDADSGNPVILITSG